MQVAFRVLVDILARRMGAARGDCTYSTGEGDQIDRSIDIRSTYYAI
jgi:hypothetical protein